MKRIQAPMFETQLKTNVCSWRKGKNNCMVFSCMLTFSSVCILRSHLFVYLFVKR